MNSKKNKVVTLKNKNTYFVLEEIYYNDRIYYFILNTNDESDIKIVEQIEEDDSVILNEVNDKNLLKKLKDDFKNKIDKKRLNNN